MTPEIRNVKIINYINKKLVFDSRRLFPLRLNSTVVYVPEVSLFVHMRFGRDKQRPYSKRNFGVLQYEKITSPFLLFKHYLEILGRVIFNHCDKYLLPALWIKNHTACCGKWKTFAADSVFSEKKRKLKEVVYLSAIKLIRRLVIPSSQTTNPYSFVECLNTYLPNVHYKNSYLSIDCPEKRRG